ncbi:unnamed protein product [Darwinula stevensoni]|uniref:Uncharacterized protein n=1 Tax=Darwinula stevensoni TaxID=69355 RepID=A0A7R9FPV4_9CRUS|nr:unnamed protein product [Darwinula stevensoni]CAG0898220.1 unnamed protein product [Darwinula stevensoni]
MQPRPSFRAGYKNPGRIRGETHSRLRLLLGFFGHFLRSRPFLRHEGERISILLVLCVLVAVGAAVPLANSYKVAYGTDGDDSDSGSGSDEKGYGKKGYGDDDSKYKYAYEIRDDKTYNYQAKKEMKDGDKLMGEYRYVAPDGYLYVVSYKDEGYGFQAEVKREKNTIFPGWTHGADSSEEKGYKAPAYSKPPAYSKQPAYPKPSYSRTYIAYGDDGDDDASR